MNPTKKYACRAGAQMKSTSAKTVRDAITVEMPRKMVAVLNVRLIMDEKSSKRPWHTNSLLVELEDSEAVDTIEH